MVSMVTLNVVDPSSSPGWVKPKTRIGICCFSNKHTAINSKNKDLFAQHQNNV